MVELATVAFILVGAVFLFSGAAFSSYGVSALGLVIGGSGGYLLAPAIAGAAGIPVLGVMVGAVIGGAILGVILSFALMSLAVGAIAFVIGSYVGMAVVAGILVDGGTYTQLPVAIGFGLVLALLGTVMTKTMMVFLTSFVGAALASRSITLSGLSDAHANVTPDPLLFDVTAPLFLGLFALGVLSQFGLFKLGYVAKLLTILPGVRPLRNRAGRGE